VLGLTTVRQPLRETGHRGVSLLLRAINGEALDPTHELVGLEVVVRETT